MNILSILCITHAMRRDGHNILLLLTSLFLPFFGSVMFVRVSMSLLVIWNHNAEILWSEPIQLIGIPPSFVEKMNT